MRCRYCGKSISYSKRFCSSDCYNESRKIIITKKCEVCNQEWKTESHYQRKFGKTCSEKCNRILQSRTKTGRVMDDELIKKTIIECKGSIRGAAKKLGINKSTLDYHVKRAENSDIEISDEETGRSIPLLGEAIEFIDGLMLGDGYMSASGVAAKIALGTPFKPYAEFVSESLKKYGFEVKIYEHECYDERYDRFYIQYTVSTPYYKNMLNHFKRWYRDGKPGERYKNIKIVPRDIKNTNLMWKIVYVCDGNLQIKKKMNWTITLATNCFTYEEVLFLISLLKEHGADGRAMRVGVKNQFLIRIYKDAKKFIEFLGECPCEFFEYKWKKVPKYECKNCKIVFTPTRSTDVRCDECKVIEKNKKLRIVV